MLRSCCVVATGRAIEASYFVAPHVHCVVSRVHDLAYAAGGDSACSCTTLSCTAGGPFSRRLFQSRRYTAETSKPMFPSSFSPPAAHAECWSDPPCLAASLEQVTILSQYAHVVSFRGRVVMFRSTGADITYFMGNPEDNRSACVTQGALQQFFQVHFCLRASFIVWVGLSERSDQQIWIPSHGFVRRVVEDGLTRCCLPALGVMLKPPD